MSNASGGERMPRGILSACLGSVVIFGGPSASAETLAEAVRSAYETNPTLLERRASQRALDETYVQARAGWRPTLGTQITVTESRQDLGAGQGAELLTDATGNLVAVGGGGAFRYNSGNATLQASQPIYTGGRVRSAVDAAQADIMAGREDLRSAEVRLLQNVVQAYADVRQNVEVVAVRQDNLRLLEQQVEQAKAKVDLGQATRIDLAQSRAQLANARSQLALAQEQLQLSAAAYIAVVGHAPSDLAFEEALLGLPLTLDEAFNDAEIESPVLRQTIYAEQAASFRVAEARAAKRPNATASLSVGYAGAVVPLAADRYDRAIIGSLTITQPFYSSGVVSSQIRQALERDTAAQLAVDAARRSVVQAVSQAWSAKEATRASIAFYTEQSKEAELAFQGLREQNRVGMATTLDLLIQQQQFSDARLALIQARHDLLVSQANVLAAVGGLSAKRLASGTTLYDPRASLMREDRNSRLPTEVVPRLLDSIASPKP